MLSSMRSSFHSCHTSAGAPVRSWSARTNARSPTRIATPSPKRRDSPVQAAVAVRRAVDDVGGGRAAAARRGVHHVVVEQGEGVHQLDRSPARTTVGGGISAGADEAPVAERRAQPLAARAHHAVDLVERSGEVGDRGASSAHLRPAADRRGTRRPVPRWPRGTAEGSTSPAETTRQVEPWNAGRCGPRSPEDRACSPGTIFRRAPVRSDPEPALTRRVRRHRDRR